MANLSYQRRIGGFFHSPVNIHTSARAVACARERECAGVSTDGHGSVHENRQENDKNRTGDV